MTRQSFRTTLQQKVIKTLKWEEKNENEICEICSCYQKNEDMKTIDANIRISCMLYFSSIWPYTF